MQVDDKLMAYLENLSCLTLSDDEKKRITGDLGKILNAMEKLAELDTNGVSERSHHFDNANAFREDEVRVSFDRELILKNTPERNEEMLIAPRAVE